MLRLSLLPAGAVVSLDGVILADATVTLLLRTTAATACCPACRQPSHRVHSRYTRTALDLPTQGKRTILQITARKFYCRNPGCPRSVFCERLPELLPCYARSTARLSNAQRHLAFALGGEAGSRLAAHLSMPASPDTLLRRIQQTEPTAVATSRVLGVDDWAIRRGLTYGTILVDLERGAVIDLLPGRDGEPLKRWLQAHPGVAVISRDRAGAYAQAGAEAAPAALQVADRWHLLKNVREMLERFFERHRDKLQANAALLARPLPAPEDTPAEPKREEARQEGPTVVAAAANATEATEEHSAKEPAQPAKKQQRLQRYELVRRLHGQGRSIRQIAREMSLSRNAVRGYLRRGRCPDWKPGQARRTGLDGFGGWIDEQLQAGRDNASELHRELTAKGYKGCSSSVRRFVTKRLAVLGKTRPRANAARPRSPPMPSTRALTFAIVQKEENRKGEQQAQVRSLRGLDAEFAEVLALAEEFIALVRKGRATPLADWLARAEGSASPEVRGFAQGIRQDEAAVSAAITEPWSNGPVEGAVNRLKAIKRQMYGRASFALLRQRVLHAS
jgi:transposase